MGLLTDRLFSAIAPLTFFFRIIGFDLIHLDRYKRKRTGQIVQVWCIISITIDCITGFYALLITMGPVIAEVLFDRPSRVADSLLNLIGTTNKMFCTLLIHLIMVFKVEKQFRAFLSKLEIVKRIKPTEEDYFSIRRWSFIGVIWILLTVIKLKNNKNSSANLGLNI